MKNILLKILELLSEDTTHKSGEKAPVSGVFRSGSEYIPLAKSERFPPSKEKWKLVVKL